MVARKVEQYLRHVVYEALKAKTRRRLGESKDVSMEAIQLEVTEMNNAFRESTAMAARAALGASGGVLETIGEPHSGRRVRRLRSPQRERLFSEGRGAGYPTRDACAT